jgi:hypothetical protein
MEVEGKVKTAVLGRLKILNPNSDLHVAFSEF